MRITIGTDKAPVDESIFQFKVILTKRLAFSFNLQRPITWQKALDKMGGWSE